MDRRRAMKLLSGAPLLAGGALSPLVAMGQGGGAPSYSLSTFSADITPPIGSPLCGGWIKPAGAVDDPLRALGIVLFGGEKPIVLCALDWVENNNSTYDAWRNALAAAAGTDPSHVAVQCVHPHNTPWADSDANRFTTDLDAKLKVFNEEFFKVAVERTASALKNSLDKKRPITHIGTGEARVEKVASNRRLLGEDGKVAHVRMSKCLDPKVIEAPEGLIDPLLKTLSFWNGDEPVAAIHYYATHPMSYYGDGRVTKDFCGLARELRQTEQPGVFQIYFTGCAGDVAPGKYNDGSAANRPVLRDRIHAGMVAAWEATKRKPIGKLDWSVTPVTFSRRTDEKFTAEYRRKILTSPKATNKDRLIAAVILAWLERADTPVEISRLQIGDVSLVHLPGEPFIDFQLFAQQQRPGEFICVAGYGNGGMGYIPLEKSYAEGGYEPTMAFVGPESEKILKNAIKKLLTT